MNELIVSILKNFTVDDVKIPCKFLYYDGHGQPYVTWQETDADNVLNGDDEIIGYVDYYDFDVYSKGDYTDIVEALKKVLKENGFMWQPTRSSADMYETDTGYYHKTLNFAIYRESEEN